MTDTEINIAIAESQGWVKDTESGNDGWITPAESYASDIPNYCNDLNAMREVLLTLDEVQLNEVIGKTSDMVFEDWSHGVTYCPKTFTSTSRQRAEAYLRTINKWKESV